MRKSLYFRDLSLTIIKIDPSNYFWLNGDCAKPSPLRSHVLPSFIVILNSVHHVAKNLLKFWKIS